MTLAIGFLLGVAVGGAAMRAAAITYRKRWREAVVLVLSVDDGTITRRLDIPVSLYASLRRISEQRKRAGS